MNGVKRIEVSKNHRLISIVESPRGITLRVTSERDGGAHAREFRAATPEELKRQSPEAYALYNRWAGAAGGLGGMLHANNLIVRGDMIAADVRGGDDLPALGRRIIQQMRESNVPDQEQLKVVESLQALQAARFRVVRANPDVANQGMDLYNREADALRQQLKDLRLPDPGDALPPPANARLGVAANDTDREDGVVVTRVLPDSRAARIGLREGDVIQKINGNAVRTAKDLRRIVTEHPKDLALDIERVGEPMRLTEKAEAAR
jgi:membrane-associated protease RseP (regulator of RpoE activity)